MCLLCPISINIIVVMRSKEMLVCCLFMHHLFENFQVISGKSIDDIKKEALREKQERSVEFPKAPGEKNDSLASSAILSFS